MIAKLVGKIAAVFPDFSIIDVNGVGYKVEGYSALPGNSNGKKEMSAEKSEFVEVYISTYVREQEIRLFGFNSREELVMFEQLLGVSGVGPRAALTLVNTLGVDSIISAITNNKPQELKLPGVGTKTTEKIVIELRSKISKLGFKISEQIGKRNLVVENEVTGALASLGYTQKEITAAMSKITILANDNQQELIKKALSYLRGSS
ncbi:MAG TPA: Holliday junction branch migration protein RuvA [Candidatus Dojkabacteria bacterium]|nr:Holliday junction branch migration protein RuvA [Candidatus Dojkabacteria bacterium]